MKSSKARNRRQHKRKATREVTLQQQIAESRKVAVESDPAATEILDVVLDIMNENEWFQDTGRRRYFSHLVSEIVTATKQYVGAGVPSRRTLHQTLTEILVQQNFNSGKLYRSWFGSFSSKLSAEPTSEQKLNLLYLELKKVNQTLVEPDLCFDERFPSLKSMLDSWIGEEIEYLEQTLSSECESTNHPVEEYFKGRPLKLQLDMSVAQLACLVRALVERNIIVNSNLTELSVLMGKFVITKRVEKVSPNSFRHKYYEIEDSSRETVKRILKATIEWLSRK